MSATSAEQLRTFTRQRSSQVCTRRQVKEALRPANRPPALTLLRSSTGINSRTRRGTECHQLALQRILVRSSRTILHPWQATTGLIRARALSLKQLLRRRTGERTSADNCRRGSSRGRSTSELPLHTRSTLAYTSTRAILRTSARSINRQRSNKSSSDAESVPMTTPRR